MMTSTRYAIITGAGSGLGRALARELAADRKQQWKIALADIDEEGSRQSRTLVEQAGGAAQIEWLDVRGEEQWVALREKLSHDWPRLDLLVNNAGVCASGQIGAMPIPDWDWLLETNLKGTILGCHTMLPWLKENPHRPHILNVASMAGLLCPARMGAYNVSKAGIIALSETLYQELKPLGIGVTAVCPWFVRTNLVQGGRFVTVEERMAAAHFMKHSPVSPEQFAREAVRAVRRRTPVAVVGRRAAVLSWVKRIWPRLFLQMSEITCRQQIAARQRELEIQVAEPVPAMKRPAAKVRT